MVRRYRRKKRRTTTRRRRRRGFKRGSKRTSYDGIYYFKTHFTDTILADLTPDNASFLIGGGQSGTSVTGAAFYIDDSAEWGSVTGRFKMWRLLGMKLKVFPRQGSDDTKGLFSVSIASDP